MVDGKEGPKTLKVNEDLGWVIEEELREKCRSLLNSSASDLVIDISDSDQVCSANMVVFAYVGAMAAKAGKTVKIIASRPVARTFQRAALDDFLTLETVGE